MLAAEAASWGPVFRFFAHDHAKTEADCGCEGDWLHEEIGEARVAWAYEAPREPQLFARTLAFSLRLS